MGSWQGAQLHPGEQGSCWQVWEGRGDKLGKGQLVAGGLAGREPWMLKRSVGLFIGEVVRPHLLSQGQSTCLEKGSEEKWAFSWGKEALTRE